MKLTDSQRSSLIKQMMAIVSTLPYRGFSRYWKELAEVDTIRVALGMSFEDVSRVLAKKGLKLSIMSQTRIANGLDTHDGKPCQALQKELAKARAKVWVEPNAAPRPTPAPPSPPQRRFYLSPATTIAELMAEAGLDSGDATPDNEPPSPTVVNPTSKGVQQDLPLSTKPAQNVRPPPKAARTAKRTSAPPPKVQTGVKVGVETATAKQEPMMTTAEVAAILATSPRQIRNMAARGQFVKQLKVPGLGVRFMAHAVREWLERLGK